MLGGVMSDGIQMGVKQASWALLQIYNTRLRKHGGSAHPLVAVLCVSLVPLSQSGRAFGRAFGRVFGRSVLQSEGDRAVNTH